MAATETVYILEDVIPYFETLIENQNTAITNQQAELERLQDVCNRLETQTELQQEMINGLELVVNYQFATLGTACIVLVIALLWSVFNKWFFRGV
ncbi:MAG: hypothetical protein IJT87_13360 [Ruminiclostridium sp.]|nr:hypothetical protein [Ruminiclostridium sp.]